jgi:hypothetical protein
MFVMQTGDNGLFAQNQSKMCNSGGGQVLEGDPAAFMHEGFA